ncbi:MAG TPA: hypothetical protein PKA58_09635 [Polyangium sp.]|nr:hypothetical protein [Polyangium sp.]
MSRKPIRVLLDSNVWRHLAEAGAGAQLVQVARKKELDICVAPCVVYEALRTSDAQLRDALVRLMVMPVWVTMMPEAYDEAEEFLSEVRRVRPQWLRVTPDLRNRNANRIDWQRSPKSFWVRLRDNPDNVAQQVKNLEGDAIERARKQAKERRQEAMKAKWHFDGMHDSHFPAQLNEDLDGWDGDDIDAWRIDALTWATNSLKAPPYSDWIEGFVALSGIIHDTSWVRFWLYDVDARHMPRWWIRTVCWILQSLRKVTDGTPCDEQLATHLFSCDVFYSCDGAIVDIMNRCSRMAPHPMGQSIRLGSENPAKTLINRLETLRQERAAGAL